MIHKGTISLETERLILRRFFKDDLEPIFKNCWSNVDVWKWSSYDPMNSIDDIFKLNNIFTDFWFAQYNYVDHYDWAIQLKATKDVIGRIRGIHMNDYARQVELVYEIGKNWWNQGLMTEAVRRIIVFFFEEVGINRIYANHAIDNRASGSILLKCKMRYEGTMRQALRCNNGLYDQVNYAILAEDDWQSLR